jgi:hypothetical protein
VIRELPQPDWTKKLAPGGSEGLMGVEVVFSKKLIIGLFFKKSPMFFGL